MHAVHNGRATSWKSRIAIPLAAAAVPNKPCGGWGRSVIPDPRISRLTERQKDCLELVAKGYTAKEIGRMLGISYSTVNNHLQAAIQLLEVGGRKEAARLYSQTLENPAGQRVPSEPADLASAVASFDHRPVTWNRGWRRIGLLLPPLGGIENALSPSSSFLAVFRVAFLGALAFIACEMIIKVSFDALT